MEVSLADVRLVQIGELEDEIGILELEEDEEKKNCLAKLEKC